MNQGCQPSTALLGSYSEGGQLSFGHSSNSGGGSSQSEAGGSATGGATVVAAIPTFAVAGAIDSLFVSGKTVTDPAIRGDGLELYYMSTQSGNKSIWRSTRSVLGGAWGVPEFVDSLNSDSWEQNPRLSADGLRIWFYSDRDLAKGPIWEATRSSTSASFGSPTVVPGFSATTTSQVSAASNLAGTIAIVSTLVSSKTGYELIEWRRSTNTESFANGVGLANVNSTADDFDPWLSSDGLVLAFHSNRSGNDDLFWTSRETVDDDFPAPTDFGSINSTMPDNAPSLTRDLRRIVFASTRDGDERLYEAVAVE